MTPLTERGSDRVVGIIGGMGPEATVDLMARIIRATPAADDTDHIRLLVDNNPKVPSRIRALIDGDGESPLPCLREMAQGLERQGADLLVMPCNSAHAYLEEIAAAVAIPLVDMIALTIEKATNLCAAQGHVGILASTAVHKTRLYEAGMQRAGLAMMMPGNEGQARLMTIIGRQKSGQADDTDVAAVNRMMQDFCTRGAACVVIACTELSVMGDRLSTDVPIVDASQVLAEYVVQLACARPATE